MPLAESVDDHTCHPLHHGLQPVSNLRLITVQFSVTRFPQLLAAFAVFVFAHAAQAQAPVAPRAVASAAVAPGTLTLRAAGRTLVLSVAELAALPRVDIQLAGDAPGDSSTVSGVRLWDVIQRLGVPAAEASGRQRAVMSVVLTGRDAQRAVLALVEVDPSFSIETILLAERRNGAPLADVEGAWRAIVPNDRRHARWIRDVVGIEVVAPP